jgi:mycothiol synthase
MHDHRIDVLLTRVSDLDNTPALSDAKLAQLGDVAQTVLIEEGDEVVAMGVTSHHLQSNGMRHWAVETVVVPGLRFDAFEDRLLATALDLVPSEASISVWSHRSSLDAALGRAGFVTVRELAYMVIELPVSRSNTEITVRSFEPADAAAVVALNRNAFASHREAASLSEADVEELVGSEGMRSGGFLIAEDDVAITGFCWTRVHANGDGEIYRIAVSPQRQGRGLGRSLLVAGFDYLAGQPEVTRGTLWVDLGSEVAVSLYESVGMQRLQTNREFERPGAG